MKLIRLEIERAIFPSYEKFDYPVKLCKYSNGRVMSDCLAFANNSSIIL